MIQRAQSFATAFQRNARLYLLNSILVGLSYSVFALLFNLSILARGYPKDFWVRFRHCRARWRWSPPCRWGCSRIASAAARRWCGDAPPTATWTSGSVSPGHSWQDEGYLALVRKVLVAEPLGQLLFFHELEVEKEK